MLFESMPDDCGAWQMIKPADGALLEEAVLLPLVVQISLALHYLHSHTIVHRDLKPASTARCTKYYTEHFIYLLQTSSSAGI